jgi:hypothetical protein
MMRLLYLQFIELVFKRILNSFNANVLKFGNYNMKLTNVCPCVAKRTL